MSNPVPIFQQLARGFIRLVVMMYVRYPLSLRNVEDLLAERGIDISHETVSVPGGAGLARCSPPRFVSDASPLHMRGYPQWRWHLDEVFVKVNGRVCYLWRAVDHEDAAKSPWRLWSPRGETKPRR